MQDKALYSAVQRSDEKALSTLFDKYFQDLCFYSFQIIKSKELSEEVVADVFIKIWNNRGKAVVLNLKNYLYKSVKNGSLQAIKDIKPRLCVDDSYRELHLLTIDIESHIMEKESLEHVIGIINKMPVQRRTVFELNRINGLKYKEIAEVMNISVRTVQNQMIKAVQFMHENFSENSASL